MFVSSQTHHIRVKINKARFMRRPIGERAFLARQAVKTWPEGFYVVLLFPKASWPKVRVFFPELLVRDAAQPSVN